MGRGLLFSGFFAPLLLILLGWAACGPRPESTAVANARADWSGDAFFSDAGPGPWSVAVRETVQKNRTDTLPGDARQPFRIPPNEDEHLFFPRWKHPLDDRRTLYLVETEDDGYRNAWLYVREDEQGVFWPKPLLAAYFYREEDQIGALETWAAVDSAEGLSVWQREHIRYAAVDSLPDEPVSERFFLFRPGDGFWEKIWVEDLPAEIPFGPGK
jgi:hypothetical protein